MICNHALTRDQQLRAQKLMIRFNLMNGFSYMCLGETVIILFAVKIDCPNVLIAALGAVMQLAFLMMPLGKYVTGKVGAAQSQANFWVARNICALGVASAAIWETLGMHYTAMTVLMLGAFFFYGFRAAGCVMSQPLAGEITLERDRAKYFANTSSAFYVTSLAALLLISGILRLSQSLWVLTGVIIMGSFIGINSSRIFRKIDESRAIRDSARRPIRFEVGHAWRNSHFRSLQWSGIAINATIIMLVPVSMLTLKRGCGVSDTGALLFSLVQFGSATLMSRFVGKLAAKAGPRRILIVNYTVLLMIVWFWLFMPEPFSPYLAAIPFFLAGSCGVVNGNMTNHYFLRAVPGRAQVAASMVSSLLSGALAGFIGMCAASGLMQFAQYLTRNAASDFTVYRVYFLLALAVCAALGLYPVLHLKKFSGEKQ